MAFRLTAVILLGLSVGASAFLKVKDIAVEKGKTDPLTLKENVEVQVEETGKTDDDPVKTWNAMMAEYKPKQGPEKREENWKQLNFFKKSSKVGSVDKMTSKVSAKQRMRVISDVHIGGCWSSDKGTRERFVSLLRDMAGNSSTGNSAHGEISHLVFLGDLFDWWLVPLSESTPHPTELFESHDAYGYNVPEIINLIKKISKTTKIYLVRGNHDDAVSKDLTKLAFGDAVQFMEDGFEMDGVWLEHGNIIDMYSNPPTGPDGIKKKGFSYFVTRAGADEDGWQCTRKANRAQIGDDAYVHFVRKATEYFVERPYYGYQANRVAQNWWLKEQLAVPQNFLQTHLRSVLELANPGFKQMKYDDLPVTGLSKDGSTILWESRSQNYTLKNALEDHVHDLELWIKNFGSQHTFARLYASGLENHFKWAPLSRKHTVLVSGHTHSPYIASLPRADPLKSVSDDVVLVNSGAFAQDSFGRDHSSYIDITFQQASWDIADIVPKGGWTPHAVRYYEYPEEEPREESLIPLQRTRMTGLDLMLHPDKTEMVLGQL